jgi:hypothetical protein
MQRNDAVKCAERAPHVENPDKQWSSTISTRAPVVALPLVVPSTPVPAPSALAMTPAATSLPLPPPAKIASHCAIPS